MSPDVKSPDFPRPVLYLVDGYALIYRAFYAMISRPLTNSRGENTSAPFGLARFLISLLEDLDPEYVGVVFDAGDSFRTEVHPEYKATREKMPEELEASLPRCRELVEAFRIPVVEAEGWEADDVIGTLVARAEEEGDLQTVVVSGDKDLYQLVSDHTWLLNPGRGGHGFVEEEWVTPENAAERLGVPPEMVTDYLALVGDSSDNIPGVRGIGKKTAPKLLEEWRTVEEILEHAGEVSSTRARNALAEHGEDARLSKELVTLRTDAPVELDLDALRREEPDRGRLRDLFLDLEFHTLVREFAPAGPEVEEDYELVTDAGRAREVVDDLRAAGRVSVDTETTSRDPMRAELVGVSLAAAPGRAFYLPFGHRPAPAGRDDDGNPALNLRSEPVPNLPPFAGDEMEPLREMLADPEVPKVGQNLKYDRIVLERAGGALEGIDFDTSLASYCLDPGKREHSLDILVMEELGRKLTSWEDVAGSGASEITFDRVPLGEALQYAGEDADYTLRLAHVLEERLEDHEMLEFLHRIEMPLIPVLAAMEQIGIGVDRELLSRLEERVTRELRLVEEEIAKIAGEEVNPRSVPQLRELLFEELDLPVLKRTKTGPSTDESVLSELAARGHEVPRLILEYRELDKLNSTYVSVLPGLAHPETGRIHTSFNQTVAATGRLSSSDPNLQNIPVRSVLGREVRKAFVPDDGWTFLAADYSQVELRVLAHLSRDEAFVEAFRGGRDIHRETAARIFGVAPEDVNAGMRDQAKTINFATIYGQGPRALARQLGVSRERAGEFIEQYFQRFRGVREYLERMEEEAREKGYVETLSGRRRYIPEVRSKNPSVRGFGERTAANSPIQGTAADLIKLAMIELHDRLDPGRARMLLQVHDELLFEVREDAVEETADAVREEMEGAMELDVPLEVEMGTGGSWYECKP